MISDVKELEKAKREQDEQIQDLCANRRVTWLAGYPKSGTTWVRMFLNALCSGFDLEINSPYRYVEDDNLPHFYQRMTGIPCSKLNKSWIMLYRPAVLATILLESHSRDRCLRTHWAHLRAYPSGIAFHPPELSRSAAVIVRDPRDVAVSMSHYTGESVDECIKQMANPECQMNRDDAGMYHYLSSWSNWVRSWTTENDDISHGVIRYEDLKTDTIEWMKCVAHCTGPKKVPDERYEWAAKQTSFDRLKREEAEKGFQRKREAKEPFFRKGRIGSWREELTREQTRRIEEDHGEVMLELGYELEEVRC